MDDIRQLVEQVRAVNRSVKIIERRVNELGLTEPVIQRQGKDRIIVELPGVKDPDKAIAMLGRTALLEFKDAPVAAAPAPSPAPAAPAPAPAAVYTQNGWSRSILCFSAGQPVQYLCLPPSNLPPLPFFGRAR